MLRGVSLGFLYFLLLSVPTVHSLISIMANMPNLQYI